MLPDHFDPAACRDALARVARHGSAAAALAAVRSDLARARSRLGLGSALHMAARARLEACEAVLAWMVAP